MLGDYCPDCPFKSAILVYNSQRVRHYTTRKILRINKQTKIIFIHPNKVKKENSVTIIL